ncbi:MAG: hypothetical protein ACJAX5_001609 [Patiriisocius sp.]|jgi:hypothetical protein
MHRMFNSIPYHLTIFTLKFYSISDVRNFSLSRTKLAVHCNVLLNNALLILHLVIVNLAVTSL